MVKMTPTEDFAQRLETLASIFDRWATFYGSRDDTVTAGNDSGQEEAYQHCSSLLLSFAQAVRCDEAAQADLMVDLSDQSPGSEEEEEE